MLAVLWSSRAKLRSASARVFQRLPKTPLIAHCTVLGDIFSFVTTPFAASSLSLHEKSGLSFLPVSAEKLSYSPAPLTPSTSSDAALEGNLNLWTRGAPSASLAVTASRRP